MNSDDSIPQNFTKQASKKGKSYYREKFNYAECTFNTALLPIKLSLPMVSPPSDWSVSPKAEGRLLSIADIYGGYLSNPTGQIFKNYRTISTPDLNSFFIYFDNDMRWNSISSRDKVDMLCQAINGLQRQAFRINSVHLKNRINNRELLESSGLLMPNFLSELKLNEACDLLREIYNRDENKGIRSIYGYSELVTILSTNMQRSQYEQTIIQLAKAYEGYSIYYPAFLDFRGRVYRSGIFHFHERDFARSLILIDKSEPDRSELTKEDIDKLIYRYLIATAFHYQNFTDERKAFSFIKERLKGLVEKLKGLNMEEGDPKSIYHFFIKESKGAKRLFQYISNIYLILPYIYKKDGFIDIFQTVPVTQDASASAYQIMAYFLLDESLALRTNLIQVVSCDE